MSHKHLTSRTSSRIVGSHGIDHRKYVRHAPSESILSSMVSVLALNRHGIISDIQTVELKTALGCLNLKAVIGIIYSPPTGTFLYYWIYVLWIYYKIIIMLITDQFLPTIVISEIFYIVLRSSCTCQTGGPWATGRYFPYFAALLSYCCISMAIVL